MILVGIIVGKEKSIDHIVNPYIGKFFNIHNRTIVRIFNITILNRIIN